MRTCLLPRYTVSPVLLDIISFRLAFLFHVHFLPSDEIKPRKRYHQMAQKEWQIHRTLDKFRKCLGK